MNKKFKLILIRKFHGDINHEFIHTANLHRIINSDNYLTVFNDECFVNGFSNIEILNDVKIVTSDVTIWRD